MPFIDTDDLEPDERVPGWIGKTFHSPSMTFGQWTFTKGSSIQERIHPHEGVWQVIEGELEVTIAGDSRIAGPGLVAIVPPNTPYAVLALTDGRAMVVDWPLRD